MAYLKKKDKIYYLVEKVKHDGKWKEVWKKLGAVKPSQALWALNKYHSDDNYLRAEIRTLDSTILKQAAAQYFLEREAIKVVKPLTLKDNEHLMNVFVAKFGDISMDKINPVDVQRYLVDEGLKPATIEKYVRVLRQVYVWAIKNNIASVDITKDIKRPKVTPSPPRFASKKDINKVFKKLSAEKRVPFSIMLYSGLRPSECFKLQAFNVDLKAGHIDLYPHQTKTASRGIIPIHSKLTPLFKKLLRGKAPNDYLFPARYGDGHQKDWQSALRRACADAEVKITAYQLRHTFATQVLEKTGGDLRTVQQLLRHQSIAMTTRYATALDKTLKSAINKLI